MKFINQMYRIKSVLVFSLFCLFAIHSGLAQDSSGPKWVKQELIDAGVFETPNFEWTSDYDGDRKNNRHQGMFIDALDYEGNPTKVFAWYSFPPGIEEGKKVPAVVCIHGGTLQPLQNYLVNWNERGYAAINVALGGQGGDNRRHSFSGPSRPGVYNDMAKDLHNQWAFHAVAGAILTHSVLRSFPEIDTANIGLTGLSWGGIMATTLGGLDDRYKFIVPVYGCGYLYESAHYGPGFANKPASDLEFYMKNWDPSLYIPFFNAPTLYINRDHDKQFTMNILTKSYHALTVEKYLSVRNDIGHGGGTGSSQPAMFAFADYITGNGAKPVSFAFTERDGNSVTFNYEGTIKSARLYTILDPADWHQDNVKWDENSASFDANENTIAGTIPNGTQYFYVNVTDEDGSIYASPMIHINAEPDDVATSFPIEPQNRTIGI